jgi:hypothetical protein
MQELQQRLEVEYDEERDDDHHDQERETTTVAEEGNTRLGIWKNREQ